MIKGKFVPKQLESLIKKYMSKFCPLLGGCGRLCAR